ncbi:MAG: flagellar export chaperone FliS [Planctomycetota bacterium]
MNGVEVYKEHAVATQSKGRLIVMLYEGAIKFLNLAAGELEAGNYAAKGQHIVKAQDIINELNAVLDMDSGGEVAENLRRLYCFMIKRLSEANIKKDPRLVREVIKLLEELNQSWKVITG